MASAIVQGRSERTGRGAPTWSPICASRTAERENATVSGIQRTLARARMRLKVCVSSKKRSPIATPTWLDLSSLKTLGMPGPCHVELPPKRRDSRPHNVSAGHRLHEGVRQEWSIANWAPWNAGKPSATSMRRWSCMLAPRDPRPARRLWWRLSRLLPGKCEPLQTPTRSLAAPTHLLSSNLRGDGQGCRGRPHRQVHEDRGTGRRNRRRRKTLNRSDSNCR